MRYLHWYICLEIGFIPQDENENPNKLSITELEYKKAKEKEIPCLIFLLDEDTQWPPRFIDGTAKSGIKSADNINRFRSDLKNDQIASFFENSDQLASRVVSAVNKVLEELKHIYDTKVLTATNTATNTSIASNVDSNYGDIVTINTLQQLQSYYNVDPNRLVHIRDELLQEIKNWVVDWNSGTGNLSKSISSNSSVQNRKPILLMTGNPGSGKSWLTYRLVSELMSNNYKISIVNGVNIRKQFFVANSDSAKGDAGKEDSKGSVFVLDDRGAGVGVTRTFVTLEDIYQILKVILPSGLDREFAGPLVLSIREANWNYIMNGAESKVGLDEYRLKELVKEVVLQNLEYEESIKMVESFYKVDESNKNPPYPNLQISNNVKEKIIERSRGIPFIIKLFFEQITNSKDISQNKPGEVTLTDAEAIISNAKYYALRQIFNYYPIKKVQREKVSNVFSFLYFLARNGSISIGLLDYLSTKEIEDDFFPDYAREYLYSSNDGKPFPLFNVDNYGIIVPFHDSISEAIISLVNNPEDLEAEVPLEYEDIVSNIREVNKIDIDINIKEKAENRFINQYESFILKAMDYYFEKKINREIQRRKSISSESAYNFLSLFIEFIRLRLKPNTLYYVRGKEKHYSEKFKQILENSTIQYGNLERTIDEQLYWLFEVFHWFSSDASPSLSQYYLKLFISKNKDVSVKLWNWMRNLIGTLSRPEDIAKMKEQLFCLLGNPDESIRLSVWCNWNLYELIVLQNIVTLEYIDHLKPKFFDLLQSKQEDIRTGAWKSMSSSYRGDYLMESFLTRDDADILLDFLKTTDEKIRSHAWDNLTGVMQILLKPEEIAPLKDSFLGLLQSTDENIRLRSWDRLYPFLTFEIFKPEEIAPLKDSFLGLLKSIRNKVNYKSEWYSIVSELVKRNVLAQKDVVDFLDIS